MRKHIKRGALTLAARAGVLRAFASSAWRAERLIILCYHGISLADEHEWDPSLYMSPADFEQRLALLKRRDYRVLPLTEAIERLYLRDLPPRAVALTFDDGNYDFYQQAWPLLRAYNYPATVYLTTYYCEDNRPVFNPAASYLLWKARGRVLENGLDLRTSASRTTAWQKILWEAETKRLTAGDKDQFLEHLAALAGVDYREFRRKRLLHIMSPEEVRELHAAGLDVQLHTHRHRTPLDRVLFLREIQDNRKRIAEWTGADPQHFCYPCGVNRPDFLPWLRESGVRYATTCVPRPATAESDALLLPRFVDHANLSAVEFESGISGLGLLLPNGG